MVQASTLPLTLAAFLQLPETQPASEYISHRAIQNCAEHGTELGWLIDSEAESILTLSAESQIKLFRGSQVLPTLFDLDFALSAEDVFNWLHLPS